MSMNPTKIVNLENYPFHSGNRSLAQRFRQQLDDQQYCVLPRFILEDARAGLIEEVRALLPHAHANKSRRNCYLRRVGDESVPEDHPRNMFFNAGYRMLAYDLFGENSALRALYNWHEFREFVAQIVGVDQLYPNEDPYQPANVLCYGPGDNSAWHFDSTNAFTMTLMLQAAERGGEFQI